MGEHFTPEAQARWEAIPARAQEKILDSTWCPHCQERTTLQLQGGALVAGDLILVGGCVWCGRKVARLVEKEPPAPPAFQVGDRVIWLKRIPGGDYVFPIAATILEFTARRVKIAAEDTEVSSAPVVRYVPPASLQHRG